MRFRIVLLPFLFMLGSTITNASPDVVRAIIESAARNGVPANIALGIASHESQFNPTAINTKNTNGTTDWGVMQLNDVTVKQLGVTNPLDPIQNIEAGVGLLGRYLRKYGDVATALWAYASGEGSVAKGVRYPSEFISTVSSYDASAQGLDYLTAGVDTSGSGDVAVDTGGSYMPSATLGTGLVLGAIALAVVAVIALKR